MVMPHVALLATTVMVTGMPVVMLHVAQLVMVEVILHLALLVTRVVM
jgi:hypothetical protein